MVQKKTGLGLRQDRIFQVKPDLDKSDIDSVVNYLNSGGWLTEHKITESFEKEIKDYVDRKSAFSVPNGTIAIYLSILASGIKKGSRVAVPNLTMIATINAVLWAESIPVLVDVDETLCMSYEKLTEVNDLDAVIFDENFANWSNSELMKFEERMIKIGFKKRYDSEGIQTWIRKPGVD